MPLARACLVLHPARVSAEALEGFSGYSHCWILYVFHLNTDLEKMWKDPARSKIKAKVKLPDCCSIFMTSSVSVVDSTVTNGFLWWYQRVLC